MIVLPKKKKKTLGNGSRTNVQKYIIIELLITQNLLGANQSLREDVKITMTTFRNRYRSQNTNKGVSLLKDQREVWISMKSADLT